MRIHVQYPDGAELHSTIETDWCSFTLDGRRSFDVVITDRGVRVDSEATMGRRRYYYADEVTLRFAKNFRPLVTAKGHPSKPIGFVESDFTV